MGAKVSPLVEYLYDSSREDLGREKCIIFQDISKDSAEFMWLVHLNHQDGLVACEKSTRLWRNEFKSRGRHLSKISKSYRFFDNKVLKCYRVKQLFHDEIEVHVSLLKHLQICLKN